jgi:hypothetical protein
MSRLLLLAGAALLAVSAAAQTTVDLPAITVHSPRVANQAPAATFAMPVSALSFEPRADVQARNLAEGQADLSIRGSTFENVAFRLGAVTVMDPQTGHYFAEIPVAPAMLGAPAVLTGTGNAFATTNATVGSVRYGWAPICSRGLLSLGAGQYNLRRGEVYQGAARAAGGVHYGADIAYARSQSDGSRPFGDHDFERIGARLQRRTATAQTDIYAGYQAKFFGWPNLYTPFGFNETENLQTVLIALNHRVEDGDGEYWEAGLYHRRNKDDYEFNRAVPGASNPFQHTTWISGAALEGRRELGAGTALRLRGEVAADEITSTALVFGHHNSRTIGKLTALIDRDWAAADGGGLGVSAGLSWDETNRDEGGVSPLLELTRRFAPGGALRTLGLAYARTTQVATYTALNSNAGAGLFRGNPNLRRSVTDNVELQLAGDGSGWRWEGAAFYRRDDRLVDWTFRRGVTARTANPVDIATTGAELVARRTGEFGTVTLGYTYLAKSPDYGSAMVDASFYALNYARHRLTAALTLRLGREWELRWDNELRRQADNLLRTTGGDDAALSSLALAWRPAAWRGVELYVQVENLWDSSFQEVPAVPAGRRQAAFGVNATW